MKKIGKRKFVRTTIDLPVELWRRAKLQAIEKDTDLKQLVLQGLERVLSGTRKTARKK